MPIDRAEPITICMAASTSLAFKSFIFSSAILRTCSFVTEPAKSRAGVLDPLSSFAAFFKKYEAGGVFMSKVKDLSENTVIVTGIGMPFSASCVLALNALQNSMMFRPRWPNAGPIGGDGLAAPGVTCNLMYPVTFFAWLRRLLAVLLFKRNRKISPAGTLCAWT